MAVDGEYYSVTQRLTMRTGTKMLLPPLPQEELEGGRRSSIGSGERPIPEWQQRLGGSRGSGLMIQGRVWRREVGGWMGC